MHQETRKTLTEKRVKLTLMSGTWADRHSDSDLIDLTANEDQLMTGKSTIIAVTMKMT